MADDNLSERRREADRLFQEAREAYSKGRLAWAVEHARQGLRTDGSYNELRHWLAERYLEAEAVAQASRQYQLILRAAPDDHKAWTALAEIDPQGADRIKRLHEIPPDPFVAERLARGGDNFDSIEAPTAGEQPDEEAIGTPFLYGSERAEEFETLDELVPEQEAAPASSVLFVTDQEGAEEFQPLDQLSPEEAGASERPRLWEFEQDRDYWQQWLATEPVPAVVAEIERLCTQPGGVDQILAQCVRLRPSSHPEAVAAAQTAAQQLGTDLPELFLVPEPDILPLVFREEPAAVGLTTGMLRTFNEAELTFVMGRCLGPILSGYLAALQAVDLLLARRIPISNELHPMVRDIFARATGPQTAQSTPEALAPVRAVGHAWQQRVELSADRAGLLACRDPDAACSAIARCTAERAQAATHLTIEKFMASYEGQDMQKLAAIPPQENPATSPDYAAYRVRMLRWWARTEDYQAACRQLDNDLGGDRP